MQERPNVFISATTADLGSYRLAVRDTLLDQGVHPILQDHLEPDYQTLLDILRREINACDAVICLVGYVYRQEPQQPSGRRSAPLLYPDLEFDIAEVFSKPIYVFLADAQCKFDPHQEELLELRQLQQEYRDRLRQRPHKREYFHTLDGLRYKIATIRFAEPGAIASRVESLPLDVLAEPDAVAFLLERTDGFHYSTPQDEADAVALAPPQCTSLRLRPAR